MGERQRRKRREGGDLAIFRVNRQNDGDERPLRCQGKGCYMHACTLPMSSVFSDDAIHRFEGSHRVLSRAPPSHRDQRRHSRHIFSRMKRMR